VALGIDQSMGFRENFDQKDFPLGTYYHDLYSSYGRFFKYYFFINYSKILDIFQIGLSTTIVHSIWWPITDPYGCIDLLIFLTWNCLVLHNMAMASFIGTMLYSLTRIYICSCVKLMSTEAKILRNVI